MLINSVIFPFLQHKRWSDCSMRQQWGKENRRGAICSESSALTTPVPVLCPSSVLSLLVLTVGVTDNPSGVLQGCSKVFQGPLYTQKVQIPASWVPSEWEWWEKWYLIFLYWMHICKDSAVQCWTYHCLNLQGESRRNFPFQRPQRLSEYSTLK